MILLLHVCITAPMLLGNERPNHANYSVGTKNSEQDAENSAKEDRVVTEHSATGLASESGESRGTPVQRFVANR